MPSWWSFGLIQFDCKIIVRKVMRIVMKNTLLFIQNISLILITESRL